MCGIVGLIGRSPMHFREQCELQVLSDAMIHRGPDGQGRFESGQCLLGMRRLSIIDLEGGWQPLYNEDQSIALVANGEVYNFVELRKELEARGHQFRTRSDCETIAHLYEEYGDQVVDKLRGMYAFALYDRRRNRVLIVRDRMGEKPLYLVETKDHLYFASELRCLIRAGVVPFELDPLAVHDYWHYQYVPEPRCAVKGVRKLPAGHLLTIELNDYDVKQRCYWRMEDAPPVEGDPAKIVRAELERVAELVVRSDVPVGIALSSGIDSSALAALAHKNYPGSLQAFTVGYEGNPRQDERVAAKRFADHIGIPFHGVELRDADVIDDYPNMVFSRDDPLGDIAGTGYLAVMRAARDKGVRVMLLGHGGDELFWGYAWVREALRLSELKRGMYASPPTTRLRDYLYLTKPPRSIGNGLRWLRGGGGLLKGYHQYHRDRTGKPDRLVHYDSYVEFESGRRAMADLVTPGFRERMSAVDNTERFALQQPWNDVAVHIARITCETYLVSNGLAQGDRLSMAASVEARVPLVDYRIVETAIGLMKANPTSRPEPKKWLVDAVRDLLPDFVLNRPKTGFNAPWRRWIPQLMDRYGHMVEDGHLVQADVLPRGTSARRAGFAALTLELWCRQMRAAAASKPAEMSTVASLSNEHRPAKL